MKFPSFEKTGKIYISAPSSGVTGPFVDRLHGGIHFFEKQGHKVQVSEHTTKQSKGVSASAAIRMKELLAGAKDEDVSLILPPWGGEFAMELLPLLPESFPLVWIQGFSDLSTLLFSITLLYDMATIHGPNALDFSHRQPDPSVVAGYEWLTKGGDLIQDTLPLYQREWADVFEDPRAPYQLTQPVIWKTLDQKPNEAKGRILGGCLDTLRSLIGTPYAPVEAFANKYKEDGILWYFESCEMNAGDILRTFLQMKFAGWFNHATGIIIGRPDGYEDTGDVDFVEALNRSLGELELPIIYDVDIGHLPPQLYMINGAMGHITTENGKGRIRQWKKE